MSTRTILEELGKLPVFSFSDFRKLARSSYSKALLIKLANEGIIHRLKRNRYSTHTDPYLVCPWLYSSSYIGSYSALYLRGMITQLPQDIICFTQKNPLSLSAFGTKIIYKHTKHFFGYEKMEYNNFMLPVSTPEKALIDSLGCAPLHIVSENIREMKPEKLWEYAKRMNKPTARRVAYLLDKIFGIKHKLSFGRKLLLDPLGDKSGDYSNEYAVIDNIGDIDDG